MLIKFKNLDIIQNQRNVLMITGIWPIDNPSIFYKCLKMITLILCTLLTITMLIQIYDCIDDVEELSEILYIGSTMLSLLVKLYCFYLNSSYIKQLLVNFESLDDGDNDNLDLMDNLYSLKQQPYLISKYLTKIYMFITFCSCVTSAIFPWFENKPLPFPFPYFNDGPLHYPMYIFQCISITFSAWCNSGIDITIIGFMLIIGVQFDILKYQINCFINQKQEEKLKKCYIYHMKIIDLVEQIQDVFSIALFAQFCSSTVCICNTGFHFMLVTWKSVQFVGLLLYFTAMLVQLSMYCWFGNEIILKSEQVCDVCYNSKWYELDSKLIKYYIFLIMERSKRPITISIYGLATLSLSSYVSILNWSYSYFTLLRQMYDETNN